VSLVPQDLIPILSQLQPIKEEGSFLLFISKISKILLKNFSRHFNALDDLRARREQKQKRKFESDESDEEIEDSSEEEVEEERSESPMIDRIEAQSGREMLYEDVNRIRIKRTVLESWVLEPYFERFSTGLFVRAGIGSQEGVQVYRCCQIKGIEKSGKKYECGKYITDKVLNLEYGKGNCRVFQIQHISNHPITRVLHVIKNKFIYADNSSRLNSKNGKMRWKGLEVISLL